MELKTHSPLRQCLEKKCSLSERDAQVIWHPFTQMQTADAPIAIKSAKGAYLYTEDGSAYLDGISSWWVNLHGHGHPYIVKKIAAQAKKLEHVMFAGFTHLPAIELAERLIELTAMDKVFYSDNGSTAVETALKMAIQFWFNKNPSTQRKKFLSLKDGYHGETFGAMSVSGKNAFNPPFWDYLFPVEALEPPLPGKEEEFLSSLRKALATEEIAALIFEPLILGAGGMKIYSKEALDEAIRLCRINGTLTIADEVMTGFGRTGPLFAINTLSNPPDMICLSKGITGGFLPLGATLCREEIYNAFRSLSYSKAFLHGHSYSANPLACSAGLASMELLITETCLAQRNTIAAAHQAFCQKFNFHSALLRCESIGTILVLEYRTNAPSGYLNPLKEQLYRYFLEHKVLLRPFGNVVHVIPPYCITREELERIYTLLISTLEKTQWNISSH